MSASRGTQRTDPTTSRLAGWIEPVVAAAGYELEELVVTPAGRRSVVRVVVDRYGAEGERMSGPTPPGP